MSGNERCDVKTSDRIFFFVLSLYLAFPVESCTLLLLSTLASMETYFRILMSSTILCFAGSNQQWFLTIRIPQVVTRYWEATSMRVCGWPSINTGMLGEDACSSTILDRNIASANVQDQTLLKALQDLIVRVMDPMQKNGVVSIDY